MPRILTVALIGSSLLALATSPALATTWGPYNADMPAAGDQLKRDAKQGDLSGSAFTISGFKS